MMTRSDIMSLIDADYIVRIRRQLHMYPELEFDLPRTLALVRGELDRMRIPYTEKYGRSSIVAYLNPDCKGPTLGIRADMDALPLTEKTGLPFASRIEGHMHACGHDGHTAILLGAAQALKAVEDQLNCRVILIFQACEEGRYTGAKLLVQDGLMDEIDRVCGLHLEPTMESGCIGACPGQAMAASHPIIVEFFGKTAHATLPQSGVDALAMAARFYMDLQLVLTRERNPLRDECVISVGSLHSGTTTNVVPDYAELKISLRAFDPALEERLVNRIRALAEHIAQDAGGRAAVTEEVKAPTLYNDPEMCERLLASARKIVGEEGIRPVARRISSEDFAFYAQKKPAVFFRLGIRNEEVGSVVSAHCNNYMMDEAALPNGAAVFVQFALDQNREDS
ncbi:MAG: amidohydrolase [Clostridia bacterium]|nr:amidohydrolase [Clostridia bacterium]